MTLDRRAALAVGAKPNVALAESAGVALGPTGPIRVDEFQRTSDPAVYAAGENCDTLHLVLRRPVNIHLAGSAVPAAAQGLTQPARACRASGKGPFRGPSARSATGPIPGTRRRAVGGHGA